MKPEEAIDTINSIKHIIDIDNYSDRVEEALDMAIKALKEQRTHGECGMCKHFVKCRLDGKTYVCEHPEIQLEHYYDYACIIMEDNDFCSRYEAKEGDEK